MRQRARQMPMRAVSRQPRAGRSTSPGSHQEFTTTSPPQVTGLAGVDPEVLPTGCHRWNLRHEPCPCRHRLRQFLG